MKRSAVLLSLALGAAAGAAALLYSPEAEAISAAQVVGAYRVRFKGDGWLRPKGGAYHEEKLSGNAVLILVRDGADDAKVKCEMRLDGALEGGVVDLATGEPAFLGSGYVAGESLAMIDTGTPAFSNAMTLTFVKGGNKLSGHWMAVFPATDAAAGSASAFAIEFDGKRMLLRSAELSAGSVR